MLVYDKSYLWGNDLLVSPVVDSAAVSQSVYFPEGSNWFDFYDHGKYAGGSNSEVELVEEHIPVFARGGALIPMIDPVMSSDQYSTERLELQFYFDPEVESSEANLYDDDGITSFAFEKGKYELIHFDAISNDAGFVIKFKSDMGTDYQSSQRMINLTVYNIEEEPQLVKSGKLELPYLYDAQSKQLKISFDWNSAEEEKIEVNF